MATAGKLGAVFAPTTDIDGNPDIATTTDNFTGDGTTTTFTLSNEYVSPDNLTVTVDGTETTDYSINYITGMIEFDNAPGDTLAIEVTYDYIVELEQVGGFFEWSVDEEAGLEESPEFGDEVITHTRTLDSWSGSASKYFDVEDRFNDWVGEKVVLGFYIDKTAGTEQRFEAWGIIGNKSTTTPVDTLVEEDISIEGQTRLVFRQA